MKFHNTTPSRLGDGGAVNRRVPAAADAAAAGAAGDSAADAAGESAAVPREIGDVAAGAAEMGDIAAGAAEMGEARRSARDGRVGLRDLLSGEVLTREGVLANVPYLVFVAGLFVAYVALGYQFERIEREKQKTLRRVKELNAEFKSLEAQFETQLQQSQVERAVAPLGLEQSLKPPFIIEVEPLENEVP